MTTTRRRHLEDLRHELIRCDRALHRARDGLGAVLTAEEVDTVETIIGAVERVVGQMLDAVLELETEAWASTACDHY